MELSDLPGRNELIAKILEYEQFTELKLKPKIRELEKIKVELCDEIVEYSKFNIISEDVARLSPNQRYESLVDIGQKCFVTSIVETPQSSVYVHVGLGFFVELTWPAAVAVSDERVKLIQKKISNTQGAIDRVEADMAEAIEANAELKKLTDAMQ